VTVNSNIFILIFLIVLSIDTRAQKMCQSLFAESKAPVSYSETFFKIELLSENLAKEIQFLKDNKDLSTESFVHRLTLIQRKISELYVPAVQKLLTDSGHTYVESAIVESESVHLKGLRYPVFILKPESKTRLGRFARGMAKWGGVQIAYSPLLNQLHGFKASFYPGFNGILLPIKEVIAEKVTEPQILGHEIKHAQFHAYRKGLIDLKMEPPVHGYFKTGHTLDKNEYYADFFSFEELVTYAYSISVEAKKIKSHSERSQAEIQKYLKILKRLSERTLELSQNSVTYMERLPWSVMDYNQALSVQIDADTKIVLLVPEKLKSTYQTDPLKYAKDEFLKLERLAIWNIEYIRKINQSSDPLAAAMQLRADQVQWMNQFK